MSRPKTLVIANPRAGGGAVPEDFANRVKAREGFEIRFTERAGHAREIATTGSSAARTEPAAEPPEKA